MVLQLKTWNAVKIQGLDLFIYARDQRYSNIVESLREGPQPTLLEDLSALDIDTTTQLSTRLTLPDTEPTSQGAQLPFYKVDNVEVHSEVPSCVTLNPFTAKYSVAKFTPITDVQAQQRYKLIKSIQVFLRIQAMTSS